MAEISSAAVPQDRAHLIFICCWLERDTTPMIRLPLQYSPLQSIEGRPGGLITHRSSDATSFPGRIGRPTHPTILEDPSAFAVI